MKQPHQMFRDGDLDRFLTLDAQGNVVPKEQDIRTASERPEWTDASQADRFRLAQAAAVIRAYNEWKAMQS